MPEVKNTGKFGEGSLSSTMVSVFLSIPTFVFKYFGLFMQCLAVLNVTIETCNQWLFINGFQSKGFQILNKAWPSCCYSGIASNADLKTQLKITLLYCHWKLWLRAELPTKAESDHCTMGSTGLISTIQLKDKENLPIFWNWLSPLNKFEDPRFANPSPQFRPHW